MRRAATSWRLALAIGLTLFLGTSLQQAGIETTSATNAGFLTACYVVLTPFVVWALTRVRPRAIVVAAGFISLIGAWLLANGGALGPPNTGDALVLLADFAWATGIALTPVFLARSGRPLLLAFVQYAVCAGLARRCARPCSNRLRPARSWLPRRPFCSPASLGAVAYTIQIFAQAHTPPAEAALILALESIFAALAGAFLLGERLTAIGALGCVLDSRRRRRGRVCAVVRAEGSERRGMTSVQTLSLAEARRIALAGPGFWRASGSGHPGAVAEDDDRLSLHQIDSVNVLVRAHYLPALRLRPLRPFADRRSRLGDPKEAGAVRILGP